LGNTSFLFQLSHRFNAPFPKETQAKTKKATNYLLNKKINLDLFYQKLVDQFKVDQKLNYQLRHNGRIEQLSRDYDRDTS
jgi:hypothetical protein